MTQVRIADLGWLWILLALCPTSLASDETQLFAARRFLTAGASPGTMALGDMDGDGLLDVVTANKGSDDVSVMLAVDDGTYRSAITYPAGAQPGDVALGDLNGDGSLDVVVANHGDFEVSVLLGTGFGVPGPAQAQAPGALSMGVALGDLDGDGVLDLAVTRQPTDRVSLHFGQGDGSFAAGPTPKTGINPAAVSLVDVDGDGDLDLAVVNEGSSDLSILLNNGQGIMLAATAFPVGTKPVSLASGDLDGDGVLDLAVANLASGDVSVLMGQGDGSFAVAPGPSLPLGLSFASLVDVNRDGLLDLLTTSPVTVSIGGGDGSFKAHSDLDLRPWAVDATDLDGDGAADLIALDGQDGTVTVVQGRGDGTFVEREAYSAGTNIGVIVAADMDGDTVLDLVLDAGVAGVVVLLGAIDGTFGPPLSSATTLPAALVAVGDLDGNGVADVVTMTHVLGQTPDRLMALLGDGDGTLTQVGSFDLPIDTLASALALGDLDEDGNLDVVVVDTNIHLLSLFLGHGDGTFEPVINLAVDQQPKDVEIVDVDGDGHLDLVVANWLGQTVWVLAGAGDGSFALLQAMAMPARPVRVELGDLDGDGAVDLLVALNPSGGVSQTLVLAGLGDGSFGPAVEVPGVPSASDMELVDLTGDGLLDLFLASASRGEIALLPGFGDGTFDAPLAFEIGKIGGPFALGDFDNNGALDVAAPGGSFDTMVRVLRQQDEDAWCGLGFGLAGAIGTPSLLGSGSLLLGEPVTLDLALAAASAPAYLAIGFAQANVSFKGGVLVPDLTPPGLVLGLLTGPLGALPITTNWPAGVPAGTTLVFQYWVLDPAGPTGVSASNALLATTPP